MTLLFVHLRRCPGPYIAEPHAKLLRKIASEDLPSAEHIPFPTESFGPIYRTLIKGVPTTHGNLHIRSDSHNRYPSLTPRHFQTMGSAIGPESRCVAFLANAARPSQAGVTEERHVGLSTPIRRISCCADAASGHAAATLPTARRRARIDAANREPLHDLRA